MPHKPLSLDEKIAQIRALVEEVQKGTIGFDEQVQKFKQAMALIKECQAQLSRTEAEIQILIDEEWKPLES